MAVNVFSFISNIFEPAAKLVDDVHTSEEEKLNLRNVFAAIQDKMHSKLIEYENKLLEAKRSIITAEANGQSWIQRSWRPITMLTFLVLVVFDSLDWLPNRLSHDAWTLLQIGLGGYVAGRSAEKTVERYKATK
jgi:hypothetical protein